ncbi:MAG: alpha/beta fold hydrolase [Pseudomonadota bacterium]
MTTPLVLVHGFMGGSQQWQGLVSGLGTTQDVIALDLPGFGNNAHLEPFNRIETYAEWVIEELRQRGVSRYHLLGHSMGGMIAQEVAFRDAIAVEKLALYGTGPLGNIPGRFETMAESRRRAEADGPEATAHRISATWLLKQKECPRYPSVAELASVARLPALLAGLEAMEHWDGRPALKSISAPTLIIWGEHDRSYNWAQIEELWRSIAKASLCVLPNCSHLAHLESPDIFSQVLLSFLEDHPETRPT